MKAGTSKFTTVFQWGRFQWHFNWFVTLAVIAAIAGLLKLGFWQLGRAQEKIRLYEAAIHVEGKQTLDVADTLAAGDAIKVIPQNNEFISAHGEFQNQHILFLVFQTHQDQLGYEVITPFKIDESVRWLLVSRGWVNANVAKNPQLLETLTGPQRIEGHVYLPTTQELNNIDNVQWPLQIRFQNLDELERILGVPLFPYTVRLGENSPGVLIRHWPYVAAETAQHYSYAVQWFAMAAAVLMLSLVGSSNLVALLRARMAKSEEELRNL